MASILYIIVNRTLKYLCTQTGIMRVFKTKLVYITQIITKNTLITDIQYRLKYLCTRICSFPATPALSRINYAPSLKSLPYYSVFAPDTLLYAAT